ncbi:MAG: PEP-CTERM sorting domain-containing protein [Phormidesmis sp. RL_2_1]|nr:PEP-CTERM sorting domain-containing protein [Phormidesmis sp. RL_2_1]
MKLCQLVASASLLAGGLLALSSNPAQAFSFTTNYTAALSGDKAAKGDIFLNSVTLGNGSVISDFSLVTSARIVSNDIYTGGNSGAASADIGDLATTGTRQEKLTNDGARAVMNNLNLNNIIDTEDKGNFVLDLNFAKAVDNIFLWERGMNSRLDIEALDASGNVIGSKIKLSNSSAWDYAGFKIDTKEIGSAQKVGSIGLGLADFGITSGLINSVRVTSEGKAYNGPDFKLLGSVAAVPTPPTQQVPEPSALLGLGAIAGSVLATRRRKSL